MNKRKALGQHFLAGRFALKKIIGIISPHREDLIIEIGAGRGALTFPLAEQAGRVIAIEKDKTLVPFLRGKEWPNLVILEADVLKIDFKNLLENEPGEKSCVKLVGNLPYSISSPLLFKLLDARDLFDKCVFMLQKEVAERVCAKPGSKTYAPLSILFQIYFEARLHFRLSPKSFSPPPQVDSALISLTRRERPLFPIANETLFRKFLKTSFEHRRKTLLNNLKKSGFPASLVSKALEKFSLSENVRPEQVPISSFISLFDFLSEASLLSDI